MTLVRIWYLLQIYSHLADWMLTRVMLKILKMEQNPVYLSTISFAKLEKERNSQKNAVWQKNSCYYSI